MITCACERTFSHQIQSFPSSTLRWRMKRVKSYYRALHVLKTAEPRLRKAIISNCKKELVNSIYEYVLNVLNGIIKLTCCNNRTLRKHKALRKVVDKRVPLWQEEAHSSTRRVFVASIESCFTKYPKSYF